MIKEMYCSFEVSKLLKEKGFNERSAASYDSKDQLQEGYAYWNKTPIWHAAPTHQMAMAWLREKNISIEPSVVKPHYWVYTIYEILNNKVKELYNDGGFDSHEEAVEAALKYVLENLI